MSTDTLDEVRRSFQDKKAQLTKREQEFAILASSASSNFERVTEKAISKDAKEKRHLRQKL